ncbi:hypothetical protein ABZ851_30290 [Streptomyces sp. NPDC047049]|uniref:hypothetical protein n=1 Tax=Streptomyces sp. NPDC047049 TaxID=3156688 RepID=UPI0033C17853
MGRLQGTNLVITPLTNAEQRVLEQLSFGHGPGDGSTNLVMQPTTFNRHSAQIGLKLQVKGLAVKVQMGFVTGQLPLPEAKAAEAEFDKTERRLWRALALHAASADIAKEASIEPFDLPGVVTTLLEKAGAANEAHLIRLGHAYGVLTQHDVPPPRAA